MSNSSRMSERSNGQSSNQTNEQTNMQANKQTNKHTDEQSSKQDSNKKISKTYCYYGQWEEDYFVVLRGDKCVCCICKETVGLPKKGRVKKHFTTNHKNYDEEYPHGSEARKAKIAELKAVVTAETQMAENEKLATIASLKVIHTLVKHKPFQDGEIWKEAFVDAGETLFQNFPNKADIMEFIKSMSFSNDTISARTEDIGRHLGNRLREDILNAAALSLQFYEFRDYMGIKQLSVFIRMSFPDMTAKEDLLAIIYPEPDYQEGEEIFSAFKNYIEQKNFPVSKLVALTSDGGPIMTAGKKGLMELCRDDGSFPRFIDYHPIVECQGLCARIMNFNHVMGVTFKAVNCITSEKLLRDLLNECCDQNSVLLVQTNVRWLTRNGFLSKFRKFLGKIRLDLLHKEEDIYEQLSCKSWRLDLAFFCDITEKLDGLHAQLRDKENSILELIGIVKSFKEKLSMYSDQLRRGELKHFKNLEDESRSEKDFRIDKFAGFMETIKREYGRRFLALKEIDDIAKFFINPFKQKIDVEELAERMNEFLCTPDLPYTEEEIVNMKHDMQFKAAAANSPAVWKMIPKDKYPNIWEIAVRFNAYFGSTHLWETALAYTNNIKAKTMPKVSDREWDSCFRIVLSSNEPNFQEVSENLQKPEEPASSE